MSLLLDFVNSSCHKHPSCATTVKALASAFKATLTPGQASQWTRTRIVNEIVAAGYRVGTVANRHTVAGLAAR